MTRQMIAAVLYGREDVRIEAVESRPPGPGEVRVHIRAALTCGTDLKVFRRGYHARMITPPALFGHELAGEVESVGDGVTAWMPGMRVVAANSAPCGSCFYCLRNRSELCEDLLFINGAYAEYITLPERLVRLNLLAIADTLPFEHAALVEPLACVVRGVEQTGVSAGDTVAVIGTGPIGLLFVRMCKLAGARVISVGRGPERLEVAGRMGADVLLSAERETDVVATVRACTDQGRGPDVVIECVGIPALWEQAITMVRRAGTVNLFGGCPADTSVRLDTARIHYDEVTVKGTFHHTPSTVREALRLIVEGSVDPGMLIQQTAALTEIPAVLRSLCEGNRALKVAIHPDVQ